MIFVAVVGEAIVMSDDRFESVLCCGGIIQSPTKGKKTHTQHIPETTNTTHSSAFLQEIEEKKKKKEGLLFFFSFSFPFLSFLSSSNKLL